MPTFTLQQSSPLLQATSRHPLRKQTHISKHLLALRTLILLLCSPGNGKIDMVVSAGLTIFNRPGSCTRIPFLVSSRIAIIWQFFMFLLISEKCASPLSVGPATGSINTN